MSFSTAAAPLDGDLKWSSLSIASLHSFSSLVSFDADSTPGAATANGVSDELTTGAAALRFRIGRQTAGLMRRAGCRLTAVSVRATSCGAASHVALGFVSAVDADETSLVASAALPVGAALLSESGDVFDNVVMLVTGVVS